MRRRREPLAVLLIGFTLGSGAGCVPASGITEPGAQPDSIAATGAGATDATVAPGTPVAPDPGDIPGDRADVRVDGSAWAARQPKPEPTTTPPDTLPADDDPCAAATLGDGGYCAHSLDPTSSSSQLYSCVGHQTASVTVCPDGCRIMPDGLHDVCASAQPASGSPPIVPASRCNASKPGDCGGDHRWCTNDGQCEGCASGMFNCNGVYGCECRFGCYGDGCLQCSPDAAFSCSGNSSWCYQGQCRLCTQGFFNCDGKNGCECSDGCDRTQCK